MKKFALAATAALVATVSMAATAEAGWRWKNHRGWHHQHRPHWGVVVGPRVWIGPRVVIGNGCVVKKKINRFGEVVRKRYC
jgi:acetyltransferase-like isoleucine patch superfamily enzyme